MDVAIGVLVRPLTALALFGLAFLVGKAVLRAIPEGRVKRLLMRRIEVVPDVVSPRTRTRALVIVTALISWVTCVQVLKALGRLT